MNIPSDVVRIVIHESDSTDWLALEVYRTMPSDTNVANKRLIMNDDKAIVFLCRSKMRTRRPTIGASGRTRRSSFSPVSDTPWDSETSGNSPTLASPTEEVREESQADRQTDREERVGR